MTRNPTYAPFVIDLKQEQPRVWPWILLAVTLGIVTAVAVTLLLMPALELS